MEATAEGAPGGFVSSDPNGSLPAAYVVGGGFAGIEAARQLAEAPVRVTVLERPRPPDFVADPEEEKEEG
ncbi:MAG: NAD(P)-binding protein [Gemmatimonadota bacterium]